MTRLRIHRTCVIVLLGFTGLFPPGRDARLGIAAIAAATVIDWLYLVAPFWGPARRRR